MRELCQDCSISETYQSDPQRAAAFTLTGAHKTVRDAFVEEASNSDMDINTQVSWVDIYDKRIASAERALGELGLAVGVECAETIVAGECSKYLTDHSGLIVSADSLTEDHLLDYEFPVRSSLYDSVAEVSQKIFGQRIGQAIGGWIARLR